MELDIAKFEQELVEALEYCEQHVDHVQAIAALSDTPNNGTAIKEAVANCDECMTTFRTMNMNIARDQELFWCPKTPLDNDDVRALQAKCREDGEYMIRAQACLKEFAEASDHFRKNAVELANPIGNPGCVRLLKFRTQIVFFIKMIDSLTKKHEW